MQFLLFPQCSQKTNDADMFGKGWPLVILLVGNDLNLDLSKILSFGKALNKYHRSSKFIQANQV